MYRPVMAESQEIHVFATVIAQPDHAAEVRAALVALVKVTREEPGNLSYSLHEDPKQPGHFYFFESYKDEAALDAHMKGPGLANAFAIAGKYLAGAPVITPTKQIA